jgi:triosephosphate isomerase
VAHSKPLVAGNWKQHKTEAEAISLTRLILQGIRSLESVDILLFPPFTSLSTVKKLLAGSRVFLGAQTMSQYTGGAYTGEISPAMVREFCSHVLLGHSERRIFFTESSTTLRNKVRLALEANLIPVYCVGEGFDDKQKGQTASLIRAQLYDVLQDLHINSPQDIMIAYEPVWAIGTGQSASPAEINQVISSVIRPVLSSLWGDDFSQGVRVLYGGSVNPQNAAHYFSQPDIDGALVGGASLNAGAFVEIIHSAL